MPESSNGAPVLETRNITKAFGSVVANRDISIRLGRGEIVAFLGENGAGKSTLMNVLFGLYKPTSGEFFVNGKQARFDSPRDAIAMGLGMVHQHFMLVPTLTVTQNIILGDEPSTLGHIRYKRARARVVELSERFGLAVDPDALIEGMPVGLQQRVEILKALYRDAAVLILDEPTAVLTPREVVELFSTLRSLAAGGTSIIIITHKLEEVMSLSDRVYVLRKGELSGELRTGEASASGLARLMVGRDVVLSVEKPIPAARPAPVFSINAVTALGARGVQALRGASLSVGPGEILGIAGVEGNGQRELCETIVGLERVTGGTMLFKGADVTAWSVARRMDAGMGYVPQDRRASGLVVHFSVAQNLALGRSGSRPFSKAGIIDRAAVDAQAAMLMSSFDIRAAGTGAPVSTLSGGNQQKVILAREFSRKPAFLLVSQPTRGLDVGAIEYVYERILELRKDGAAILLVSMELDEIFALSDRIAVLHGGEVVYESAAAETDPATVGEYMIRGRAAAPQARSEA